MIEQTRGNERDKNRGVGAEREPRLLRHFEALVSSKLNRLFFKIFFLSSHFDFFHRPSCTQTTLIHLNINICFILFPQAKT